MLAASGVPSPLYRVYQQEFGFSSGVLPRSSGSTRPTEEAYRGVADRCRGFHGAVGLPAVRDVDDDALLTGGRAS